MRRMVAAVQLVSDADPKRNLASAASRIAEAAANKAKLVVLPESFALFAGGEVMALAEEEAETGVIRGFLADTAQQLNITLVAGTLPLPAEDGRLRACSLVYSNKGALLGEYQKIHLFDAEVGDSQGRYCESDQYAPGDHPLVVDTPLGRLGVAVCYDLRFPALFQAMVDLGAEIIAVPSAFTRRTGLAHWLPLMRARAIETQCLLVGANQGGIHSVDRYCSGGSVIVDCWGEVLAEAGFGETWVSAPFDRAAQRQLRQQMPVHQHRRTFSPS